MLSNNCCQISACTLTLLHTHVEVTALVGGAADQRQPFRLSKCHHLCHGQWRGLSRSGLVGRGGIRPQLQCGGARLCPELDQREIIGLLSGGVPVQLEPRWLDLPRGGCAAAQ